MPALETIPAPAETRDERRLRIVNEARIALVKANAALASMKETGVGFLIGLDDVTLKEGLAVVEKIEREWS
jgi:hypothetical protein